MLFFDAFFILQAWWIYGSGSAYFTWMNAYGTILAPIAAIFIADYFVCKKRRVNVADLFRGSEGKSFMTEEEHEAITGRE